MRGRGRRASRFAAARAPRRARGHPVSRLRRPPAPPQSESDSLAVALVSSLARAQETVAALSDKMSRADVHAATLGAAGGKRGGGHGSHGDFFAGAAEWGAEPRARSARPARAQPPRAAAAAAAHGPAGGDAGAAAGGVMRAGSGAHAGGGGSGGGGSVHPSGDEDAAMATAAGANAAAAQVGVRRKRDKQ